VDRRSFFRLIGMAAAAGVAAKVAPGLLVVQASSGCPIGLPGPTGLQGVTGATGAQGVQGPIGVAHGWTGCFGMWTGCDSVWHMKEGAKLKGKFGSAFPGIGIHPVSSGGELLS
jgi:hypothetical protein